MKNAKRTEELLKQENEKLEKRDKQISFAVSTGLIAILMFFSMFWMAFQGTIPPIDEPQWKTVGRIDFGFDNKGRKEVNNFHKPSDTPADKPKGQVKPKKVETTPPKTVSNPPPKVIESTAQSDQEVAKPVDTPKPTENSNPDPSPKTDPDKSTPTTDPTKSDPVIDPDAQFGGGSDHGDSKDPGNRGNPDAQVLDNDGMFEFGDGITGPGGRSPLDLPLPTYNSQQEGKVRFSFIIAPSGEVVFVKAMPTPHLELAEIGKKAIKRWRFSQIEESRGNLKTTVTITFRLN